jgi:peptidoglycan/LPS O-acetylase OafA/YrhL
MNYVYGNTTAIIIVSCGIFAFFVENKDKFKNKSNPVIRLCSKYSYSIILIHWYALFVVVADKLHITALRFGCIGGIVATVLATLISCIIMAIVIDNTAVIVLNTAFDKLCAIKTHNKK